MTMIRANKTVGHGTFDMGGRGSTGCNAARWGKRHWPFLNWKVMWNTNVRITEEAV